MIRFLHLLGLSMWLGSALAAMAITAAARTETPAGRLAAYRLLARVHAMVLAPGAFITVLSGFLMVGSLVTRGLGDSLGVPGVIVMQTAGLIAGVAAIFVGLPTANSIARLARRDDADQHWARIEALRKRQAFVSSASGVLIFVSLAAVIFWR